MLGEAASFFGSDPLAIFVAMCVIALAPSLAAGALFYFVIDRPAYRWHKRTHLRPRSAPALLGVAEPQ